MDRAGYSLNRDRRVFGSRLPPGVRDLDCEQSRAQTTLTSESGLWQRGGPGVQEQLSLQFAELNVELIRDAILDAEDSTTVARPSERGREILLGSALWREWIRFRDRALRERVRTADPAKG